MRWSIIRLIWLRELRDQLRDRRTLFMIVVLPLLLYPTLGFLVLRYALGFTEKPSVIGVVRTSPTAEEFPARQPGYVGLSPLAGLTWHTLSHVDGVAPAAARGVALNAAAHLFLDYPLLVRDGRFTTFDAHLPPSEAIRNISQARLTIRFVAPDADKALEDHDVDLLVSAPADFYRQLERVEGRESRQAPELVIRGRPGDDRSSQALQRLQPILEAWKRDLKRVRLARQGYAPDFDSAFTVRTPEAPQAASEAKLVDLFVRIFPFMLVLWSLAGALYPAVDLCAGEKERGTMETLLISPAGREEIVLGKFLTIWVFSAGTALLNLLSMGLTTWQFGDQLPHGALPLGAIFWCVILSLPLSAFFSAICLAIGAYARSSKEGQYYLMPLFLVTMPLIFLTLAPGVGLSPFYALVPVTGVALLMQQLMTASGLDQVPWLYFLPVLAPLALYSILALRWAIEQFNREEVLFREAERLDIALWLRRLFRDKEETPSTAQAMFCFALIVGLSWLSQGLGANLLVLTGVQQVAFVAAPALLMTIMLNTRPAKVLPLRLPQWRDMALAAALALLLLPSLASFVQWALTNFPGAARLLEDRQPLVQELRVLGGSAGAPSQNFLAYLLVYALLPAVCEELAFRGFILAGLYRRFRPRTAIFVASFFFALYHMNVFLFVWYFGLGVILGLLTRRSKSLLPAMAFHLLHNGVLIGFPFLLAELRIFVVGICLMIALATLWFIYREPYVALARRLALEEEEAKKQADPDNYSQASNN